MSWSRNLIGDAEHVGKVIEQAVEHEYGAINKKVATLEAEAAKELAKGFKAAGNDLVKFGLHIESQGHFNDDGTGTATIKITSAVVPIPAPDAPVETKAEQPAGQGAAAQ